MTEDNSRTSETNVGRTICRATAESEGGCVVRLYRIDDDRLLTYEELYDEVDAEGSALPADQWRDGVWDAHEYIIEACLVGFYDSDDVIARVVTRDIDGTTMSFIEYIDDEDQVVAERQIDD